LPLRAFAATICVLGAASPPVPANFTFQESSIMRSRSRRIAPVAAVLLAVFATAHAAPPRKATAPKAPAAQAAAHSTLTTDRQKLSYAFGMQLGGQLGGMSPIADGDVDEPVVLQAIDAMLAHGTTELTIPDAKAQLQGYGNLLQARADAMQAKKPVPANKPTGAQRHKISYAMGMQLGSTLDGLLENYKSDMDRALVIRGLNAMASHAQPELALADAQARLQAFGKIMEQRQKAEQAKQTAENAKLGQKNQVDGAAFLAANAKKPGVKSTPSGLQYTVETMGTGPKPKASDRVKVNYAGSLLDGTEFDSSAKNGGPIVLSLGGVIPGWTEGLQLMPVGSKFVFWIPGKIAYGEHGMPGSPIGPNATLKFEIELLSIEK
jgi:FKBP-type peptidyl-prolyl cis-trans isomerase FkpA